MKRLSLTLTVLVAGTLAGGLPAYLLGDRLLATVEYNTDHVWYSAGIGVFALLMLAAVWRWRSLAATLACALMVAGLAGNFLAAELAPPVVVLPAQWVYTPIPLGLAHDRYGFLFEVYGINTSKPKPVKPGHGTPDFIALGGKLVSPGDLILWTGCLLGLGVGVSRFRVGRSRLTPVPVTD